MGGENSLRGNRARQNWLEGSSQDRELRFEPLFTFSSSFQKEPKKKQQLSVCNKLCYAVGGAPYQVTGCALGFFLQIYLLDVAQVSNLSFPGLLRHAEMGETRQPWVGSLSFPHP